MIQEILLGVGIVLTGINGYMIGSRWERANGIYRKRYEVLSSMIEQWAAMMKAHEIQEKEGFLSPMQVADL